MFSLKMNEASLRILTKKSLVVIISLVTLSLLAFCCIGIHEIAKLNIPESASINMLKKCMTAANMALAVVGILFIMPRIAGFLIRAFKI